MYSKSLPYMLLLPATLFLCIFFIYPFTLVAWQAFTTDTGEFTSSFFQEMASHWKFNTALINTLLLALAVVPFQMALAIYMATLVNGMKRGRDAVLYIWTIPLGISDLAAGLIWLAIFEQSGFLNSFLHTLGVVEQPVGFLGYENKGIIFLAIVLAEIWRATSIVLVILVAGMGLIPKEYAEAAEVFGASRWQRFTRVTLPMLKPSLQTAMILRVILAFEVFAVVVALGGTNLPVLMSEVFTWQYELRDAHVAAAYALVILAISIAFTLLIMWALRVPKGARV
ncbi:carbohydrate ABC transporter permease [Granulosicoccus antarcticus]|uniref:L-arabinose transport system permease protein AraP n=1 Tax=Granulosicoccus antarcticus IMCC3135 TaxID=1192854 RepID=A0A2Z2NVT1_9GAMM|nr:sugar ABC transporter permease [Granulosicoccus antarcticus]ASJ74141.1 L-arabinose transport system permease protein AraP [Granulosicoccus antarcticus IMCC3135]